VPIDAKADDYAAERAAFINRQKLTLDRLKALTDDRHAGKMERILTAAARLLLLRKERSRLTIAMQISVDHQGCRAYDSFPAIAEAKSEGR
jgi:hypothetical protein